MTADEREQFVHPTAVTAWQLVGAAVAVMATMGIALWTIIADQNNANDNILKDLHSNYVTRLSHSDLADRLTREVGRVDELNKSTLPRAEFDRWNAEHERALAEIRRRLDALENNHVGHKEFDTVITERGRQIDSLRFRLDQITPNPR